MQTYANALTTALTPDTLRHSAPAIYADAAHPQTSPAYRFISTEKVLDGLLQAGFQPVDVRQTRSRRRNSRARSATAEPTRLAPSAVPTPSLDGTPSRTVRDTTPTSHAVRDTAARPSDLDNTLYARHAIRLRRRYETVQLRDSIPEILFVNSHDGTTAYQLRVAVYRVLCSNGLIVSVGIFPAIRVTHRGDAVEDVVKGALELSERFGQLADHIEAMENRTLGISERYRFAERALALRHEQPLEHGMQPAQLLTCRRAEDAGDDLWRTLNVIQENLMRGGLTRWSAGGRLTRTRAITGLREDIRLNGAIWDLAAEYLAPPAAAAAA